jgi:hypothetical protein
MIEGYYSLLQLAQEQQRRNNRKIKAYIGSTKVSSFVLYIVNNKKTSFVYLSLLSNPPPFTFIFFIFLLTTPHSSFNLLPHLGNSLSLFYLSFIHSFILYVLLLSLIGIICSNLHFLFTFIIFCLNINSIYSFSFKDQIKGIILFNFSFNLSIFSSSIF